MSLSLKTVHRRVKFALLCSFTITSTSCSRYFIHCIFTSFIVTITKTYYCSSMCGWIKGTSNIILKYTQDCLKSCYLLLLEYDQSLCEGVSLLPFQRLYIANLAHTYSCSLYCIANSSRDDKLSERVKKLIPNKRDLAGD